MQIGCKTKSSRYRVLEAESSRKKGKGGGTEASKFAKREKGRGRQQRGNKQRVECVEADDEYAFPVNVSLVSMVELFNSRLVVQLLKECCSTPELLAMLLIRIRGRILKARGSRVNLRKGHGSSSHMAR